MNRREADSGAHPALHEMPCYVSERFDNAALEPRDTVASDALNIHDGINITHPLAGNHSHIQEGALFPTCNVVEPDYASNGECITETVDIPHQYDTTTKLFSEHSAAERNHLAFRESSMAKGVSRPPCQHKIGPQNPICLYRYLGTLSFKHDHQQKDHKLESMGMPSSPTSSQDKSKYEDRGSPSISDMDVSVVDNTRDLAVCAVDLVGMGAHLSLSDDLEDIDDEDLVD